MGKKRESRAVWERRLVRWEKSGLTRVEFARREGVNPSTLGWWRSTLKKDVAPPEVSFVEVTMPDLAPTKPAPIEVVLLNGRTVRVPPAFDAGELARVLAVAESA